MMAMPLNPQAAEFTPGAPAARAFPLDGADSVGRPLPASAFGQDWCGAAAAALLNPHAAPYGRKPHLPAAAPEQQLASQVPEEAATTTATATAAERGSPPPARVSAAAPQAKRVLQKPALGVPQTAAAQALANTTIAGRVVEHKVYVSTPWYTKGVDKSSVQLSGEITAFDEFMALTPMERGQREEVLQALRTSIAEWFPNGAVKVYGSYAYGTSVVSSAIDVMIDTCGPLSSARIKDAVSATGGKIRSLMCTDAANAFAQLEFTTGIVVNISLHRAVGSGAALQAAQLCCNFFKSCPNARSVYNVLRQIMTQTGNLEVNTGGLSAYSLIIMLIAVVQLNPLSAATPGSLLLHFCKYVGKDFAFSDYTLCCKRGYTPKKNAADHVSVADPFDDEANLATGCTRTFQIQVQLQHCYSALLRWEGIGSSGDKKGYKGRTPLSGVISHQKLWARSEMLHHQERCAAAAAAALPMPLPMQSSQKQRSPQQHEESPPSPQPASLAAHSETSEEEQVPPQQQAAAAQETATAATTGGTPLNLSFASEEVMSLVEGLNLNLNLGGSASAAPVTSPPPASVSPPQAFFDRFTGPSTPVTLPQKSTSPGLTDSPTATSIFDALSTTFTNTPMRDAGVVGGGSTNNSFAGMSMAQMKTSQSSDSLELHEGYVWLCCCIFFFFFGGQEDGWREPFIVVCVCVWEKKQPSKISVSCCFAASMLLSQPVTCRTNLFLS